MQVSLGIDNKIPLSGPGRRSREPVSEFTARDSDEQADDCICRFHQPRSFAYVVRYFASIVCISSGAVSEGEEFAQAVVGIQDVAQAVLGSTFMGKDCWVASSGNVTDEVWKEYIKNQQPPEPDDEFTVVSRR